MQVSQASEMLSHLRWSIKNSRRVSQMTTRNAMTQQKTLKCTQKSVGRSLVRKAIGEASFLQNQVLSLLAEGQNRCFGGTPAIVKVSHHTNAGSRRLIG